MFEYGGSGNFTGRFDFFEWSAPYYETPKEVYGALSGMAPKGKKLVAIHAIGAYADIGETRGIGLYRTIRNAGMELEENWLESYPHMDEVRIPWSAMLCEPLQLVFEDGSSLEILPLENGGARIGVNSIPVGLTDGLNDGQFDACGFFKELLGTRLREVELRSERKEIRCLNSFSVRRNKTYTEIRTEYAIQFKFEYPYTLEITRNWRSWYKVCCKGGWDREHVPYKRKAAVSKETNCPMIVSGRDGGGFWIVGIASKRRAAVIPALDCFGMSVDDSMVERYLGDYLRRYYDPAVQKNSGRDSAEFDRYGGNLYTFESMRKMLDDIYGRLQTEADREAGSFYTRFCARMEHMLKIPGNDLMSFAGP